jgi:hypothetical protein
VCICSSHSSSVLTTFMISLAEIFHESFSSRRLGRLVGRGCDVVVVITPGEVGVVVSSAVCMPLCVINTSACHTMGCFVCRQSIVNVLFAGWMRRSSV